PHPLHTSIYTLSLHDALPICIDQSVSKTVQPIPMLEDALTLDVVQDCKYLLRRILVMIQERDEVRDRPLEVDIVLPERVVGINEDRKSTRLNSSHVAISYAVF